MSSERPIWFVAETNRFGYRVHPVHLMGWLLLVALVLGLVAVWMIAVEAMIRSGNPLGLILAIVISPALAIGFVFIARARSVPLESYLALKSRKS